ncbi:hypothetical protein V1J52_08075 [Streptomyces sp. TRM 70351]|uniref:hypothetical protein n=1 Tax=Streptomyces sp. TRM 70351 TaxID=3116552 RepID=UPI002E7BA177|nr:hypothetical protein [Streptomyces sp. TRM 70351]MEE1928153.1 hypothetical protein [Streptomyces sp. TRM 70351]
MTLTDVNLNQPPPAVSAPSPVPSAAPEPAAPEPAVAPSAAARAETALTPSAPALLAGEDDAHTAEPHIWRGIN